MFQEMVGQFDQFTHQSHQSDLGRFACGAEFFVKGLQNRITASGHQRGHVKRRSGQGPAMRDVALTAERATIVVVGGQARQCRRLSPRQGSQFWECGQQGPGGATTDALDRREPLNLCLKSGIGLFQGDDFLLQGLQMFSEGSLKALRRAADERVMVMFGAKLLLGQEAKEFLSAMHQSFEALLRSRWHGRRHGLKYLAVTSQDGGVNPVRFGEQTAGPGKVTDLAGVDQGKGDLFLVESFQKGVFISPRSFANHMDGAATAAEGLQKAPMAFGIMGKSAGRRVRQRAEVEGSFGDIQTEVSERRSFHE